jgi:hypothetical protein
MVFSLLAGPDRNASIPTTNEAAAEGQQAGWAWPLRVVRIS